MKKSRSIKFKCLLVALMMLFATTVFAASYGEGYVIYGDVETGGLHDNCIYSCEHTPIRLDTPVISEEEAQKLIDEYMALSSEEERQIFLAEMWAIPVEDVELYITHEEPMNEDELKSFIDEYTGVSTDSLEEATKIATELMGFSIERKIDDQQLSIFCKHPDVVIFPCTGSHSGSGCTVTCKRTVVCYYACGWSSDTRYEESSHSWSAGWCGQTCTRCGKIELFHSAGGCWYCR